MFILPLHRELHASSRLRALASPRITAGLRDWLWLFSAGMAAAVASTFLNFHLRIPGHAILRAVLPVTLGLALVPRRGAGCVMGGAALLTAAGLHVGGAAGEGLSLGALASLTAVGPLLDWTLRRAETGRGRYVAFALAGLSANLLALAVRGGAKALGWDHAGARPLALWLPTAAVTYTACGLLAGLLCGAVLFYGRDRENSPSTETPR